MNSLLRVAFLLGMTSCSARTGVLPEPEAAGLPSDFEFTLSGAKQDVENSYRTTVLLSSGRGLCSGVLMTRRLVLTAAHCLCLPPTSGVPDGSVDASKCVADVTVTAHTYEKSADSLHPVISHAHSYQGVASAHPAFKAHLRGGAVVSFEADLAVVRLQEDVEGPRVDFRLTKTEVSLDESLIMVGYGETGPDGEPGGRRRYGRNIVTDLQLVAGGNGVFAFRAQGAHSQEGDSGGPCFREERGKRWLVGVNSGHANAGTISLFTSAYHYRAWIEERIQKAGAD